MNWGAIAGSAVILFSVWLTVGGKKPAPQVTDASSNR